MSAVYSSSSHCLSVLDGIEAVDYFFAYTLCQQWAKPDDPVLFHLLLALQWSVRQGHSCLPLPEVANRHLWSDPAADKSGFRFPDITALQQCVNSLAIGAADNAPVVVEPEAQTHAPALYLRRYWQFETEVANSLLQRTEQTPLTAIQQQKAKQAFERLFPAPLTNNTEPDWQQVAVANALGRRLTLICGGPGTGKTYTVTRLLAVLQAINDGQLIIKMAAPTGKAAQRLKESISAAREQLMQQGLSQTLVDAIPQQASTLHRLLGFRPNSTSLAFNRERQLSCDLLLIDEVSMIDLPMMARVLRALPEQTILILLGDAEQLPSVETGSVLGDISAVPHPGFNYQALQQIKAITDIEVPANPASRYSHLTLLTKSHRFGGEIGLIAKEVIQKQAEASWQRLYQHQQGAPAFNHHPDCQLSYLSDELVEPWLLAACKHYFQPIARARDSAQAFAALAKFRILVPTRVGERGVEQLNEQIERQLARRNSSIVVGQHYQGRPVMVTENSYAIGLFNGDIGLIWPDDSGKLVAWFDSDDGSYRAVNLARLPHVETVYAMTIHKTQGSEFSDVAIILPEQENALLSPQLLYTGLTRAKQHLYILGSEKVWKAALGEHVQRYSGLKGRMEG